MRNMHPRNSLFLYLTWLAVTGGAVVAFASAGLPHDWAVPQNLHSCLLIIELLFVFLLWPFFARSAAALRCAAPPFARVAASPSAGGIASPAACDATSPGACGAASSSASGGTGSCASARTGATSSGAQAGKEPAPLVVRRPVLGVLFQLLTLACLAAPVNVLAARFSGRTIESMVEGSCLVLCLAFFVGVLHIAARRSEKSIDGCYLLVLFSLCAVFPVVYYFMLELTHTEPRWLLVASPFYAVIVPGEMLFFGPAWALHSAAFVMGGALAWLLVSRTTRSSG